MKQERTGHGSDSFTRRRSCSGWFTLTFSCVAPLLMGVTPIGILRTLAEPNCF